MPPETIDVIDLQHAVANFRDQKAYGKLFVYFYSPLIRFAFSIVKSKEAAEEIYADVMMKLWDLEQALVQIQNLRVYLFVSVKNASLNYVLKYNKLKIVDISTINVHLVHPEKTSEERFFESDFNQATAAAINALPAKCGLVYQLIREHGLSYKEVAQIMEISINTVEGHMTTALKKITQSLRRHLLPGQN